MKLKQQQKKQQLTEMKNLLKHNYRCASLCFWEQTLLYLLVIWWKNCALRGKSTKFGMIIVLGLLNNISYGPQSGGGGILYLGGGVVAVSK